ncbi:MAG: transcription-repair coupling factor, partial [Vallitaleaceae bacterium]|nr:transcription-repair coupling factor [Vallitaleaceae bacterium]
MKNLTAPLAELEVFDRAKKHIRYEKSHLNISGVIESQTSHLVYSLLHDMVKVVIAANEKKAKEIADDLKLYEGDQVMLYPSKDLIFYSADVHSNDITKARMIAIEKIFREEPITLVMSVEALVDPLLPKETLKEYWLKFETGQELDFTSLAKKLVYMGYERVDIVEGRGQFAIRGGILDLYPMNLDEMYRLELWGDEIDSIRLVNQETQRTIKSV